LSIEIQVQQRGLDIRILADKLESDILPRVVETAADYAEAIMASKVPVRTGRLLGSIQKRTQGSEAVIGPTEPYAVYVEYGTAPHVILPVFSRVLAFKIGGKMIFTPIAHHPGTKPRPFIHETAEDVKDRIPGIWKDIAERAII
jgi:phage gpG-like protein